MRNQPLPLKFKSDHIRYRGQAFNINDTPHKSSDLCSLYIMYNCPKYHTYLKIFSKGEHLLLGVARRSLNLENILLLGNDMIIPRDIRDWGAPWVTETQV